jgi:signal transduction histidine kinase
MEYTQLYDSLNTLESQNKLLELQARYEVDTKEKQVEMLKKSARLNSVLRNVFIIGFFLLIVIILLVLRQYKIKRRSEEQIKLKNDTLSKTLNDLKATQAQLIQSEKLASLGELTSGLAHEIQNPLNFVNNFSEVSKELLIEMKEEIVSGSKVEAEAIANDVIENLEKIHHHGKRADAIVKGMLQHSRTSSGQKELVDINALCNEYLRLAYHGLKAKDQSFKASYHFDPDRILLNVNIVPQDIGRVLLNLLNNAFYAVNEKHQTNVAGYEPTVTVATKKVEDKVEVSVKDNGNGISPKLLDKIFQPFFTTKPTGEGTGLGLSLSYDIVKAHGGELKVETKAGEGSEFIIHLPTD